MSAHPTHDLAIKAGEYQDHSGQVKGRWIKIGSLLRHDDGGASIKLDAIPVGLPGWQGWVSVFPRDQLAGRGRARQSAQGPQMNGQAYMHQPQAHMPLQQTGADQDFDDEIPFG